MWSMLIFTVLVVLLVAYVWRRQVRHPVPPGSDPDPRPRAARDGRFRGDRHGGTGF